METLEKIVELSETQRLDNIISANRRKMMTLAGSAFAGLALTSLGTKTAEAQANTISDADILNFALNLEYLEAQYYTLATTGQTIDQLGVSIKGGATAGGTVTTKTGGPAACQVPFTNPVIKDYANETAQEERNHVTFLSNALGAGAVAMPNIDLFNSFNTLASAANIGTPTSTKGQNTFDPFASDVAFLLGSYIFEDVGVTAYTGAAALLTNPKYLDAAAGIQAVEAYHAGLVRTTLFGLDSQSPNAGINATASAISAARIALDGSSKNNGVPDDIGLGVTTNALGLSASTIVNADANTLVFVRSTSQVLAIVYGGGSGKGVFFPAGLNGTIK